MKNLLVILPLALSGCATFEVATNVQPGSPRFFAGTALNSAAMTGDQVALARFDRYGMTAPAYPEADLVPSLLADTALFPFALTYSISEAILQ